MNIKTILFDMDGIVVDSEKLHIEAFEITLAKYGIKISDEAMLEFVGRSDEAFFEYIYNEVDNSHTEEEMLEEKHKQYDIVSKNLQYIKGVDKFIDLVKDKGLKTALVTSSAKLTVAKADKILDHTQFFEAIVAEEDTNRHKPFPEPYLLGLERTKSDPNTTLVIEDSINGIKAGKAAGCTVVGMTTSFGKDRLIEAGADMAFDNYEELAKWLFE